MDGRTAMYSHRDPSRREGKKKKARTTTRSRDIARAGNDVWSARMSERAANYERATAALRTYTAGRALNI